MGDVSRRKFVGISGLGFLLARLSGSEIPASEAPEPAATPKKWLAHEVTFGVPVGVALDTAAPGAPVRVAFYDGRTIQMAHAAVPVWKGQLLSPEDIQRLG